jgi:hypothetical protein
MVCIEEGNILFYWGALRLCQIMEDLLFWATRILRPQVSMYMDQWQSRHLCGLRYQLSQDLDMSALVKRIEQCGKMFGLSRNTNLADMVRQLRLALVMSEISLSSPGPETSEAQSERESVEHESGEEPSMQESSEPELSEQEMLEPECPEPELSEQETSDPRPSEPRSSQQAPSQP